MKKVFALMVVFAALFAAGCAEKETVPPPADEKAAPADEAKDMPADDSAQQNP
jgi:predicted small lipoprotein YifL